ncbi:protein PFC0760c-like [Cydia pomonella]|uniref:protein PFC0760c-like n=1 Tax=Cydia pomonella TaxID=82600 RepID=UPI002ADDA093|nr:protein PFC0760c-like [Cydia pomonella]
MPYYCTVPRCTSMAGKAKNVSFHQFPRDEELAKLWNRILKRGKPYTKYSKVCSLHFKPEDYTITSVGKNKGQWRTLRKDAIPSQNLPSESPVPYTRQSPGCWVANQPTLTDPLVQQQMAQAIYMQTMLAMQAAGASDPLAVSDQPTPLPESANPSPSSSSLSEIELLLRRDTEHPKEVTYKCHECSKCFKDPDVFILHKRNHKNNTTQLEKENYSTNIQDREETLRANPILANLLKSSMRHEPETNMSNILTVENQIMAALASNMEAYIRTLSSMLSNQANRETQENNDDNDQDGSDYDNETKDANKVECEDTDKEDSMCIDTNKDEKPMDENDIKDEEDIYDRLKVPVTACVSRIETHIDENHVFSNDVSAADNSIKDECKDTDENQSDDKFMNDNESIEKIQEALNNHEDYEIKTENNEERIETQNEALVYKYHENSNETKMLDDVTSIEEMKETIVDENHVNAVNNVVDNTTTEESDDEYLARRDNKANNGNKEAFIDDYKPNDAINENDREEKMFDDNGKLDQANPECDSLVDTELITLELET